MSDSEIDLSEESEDGDFSVSEDEYIPIENSNGSHSEDYDEDDDEGTDSPKTSVPSTSTVSSSEKSNNSPIKLSKKLSNILLKSKFQKKSITGNSVDEISESSDSDSSGDDNLVDPNKLDLNSDFFNIPKKITTPPPPDFDCNVGIDINSSSSEESEDDFSEVPEKNKSAGNVNFDKLQEFSKNLEVAKEHLKNYKAKVIDPEDEANVVDVSQLLALGESENLKTSKATKKNAPKSRKRKDSNSDWEDVQESNEKLKTTDSNLQITVELPNVLRIKTRKEVDLDACMKRKFNKIRKDHQVCLHKTNLLCWIAHGNFLNPILNDVTLMSQCLSLMPSAMSYPTEKTNLTYFKQISTWFQGVIALNAQSQYPVVEKLVPIATSLGQQIKSKTAICKRDYILIFVILLRSLGIQCRLVMNLVNNPLRPNQSDLCSLSTKTVKKTTETKGKTASPKVAVKPSGANPKKKELKPKEPEPPKPTELTPKKKGQKPLLKTSEYFPSPRRLRNKVIPKSNIPQLDGNDDLPNLSKLKNKSIFKIKAIGSYKADSSFVVNLSGEESMIESPVRKNVKSSKTPNSPFAKKTVNSPQPSTSKAVKKTLVNSKEAKNPKSVQLKNLRTKPSTAKETLNKKAITTSKDSMISSPVRKNIKITEKVLSPKPSTSKATNSRDVKNPIQSKTTDSKPKSVQLHNLRTKVPEKLIQNSPELKSTKVAQKRRSRSLIDDDLKPTTSKETLSKPLPKKRIKTSTEVKINSKIAQKRRSRSLSDDHDFQPTRPKKAATHAKLDIVKKIDSRVLSTDDDDERVVVSNKKKTDYWIEVFCEEDEKWITIDAIKGKVDCVDDIRKSATTPIAYVIAWNNDNSIKDISPRYCPQWNTTTRLLRVGKEWFDSAFKQFMGKKTRRDIKEDKELNRMHLNAPLPTSIKEFKDHPLYALERDLLKFQAIYPPNALTLGFIRKEPVYARECVHTLHSREIWLKSARTVKMGENPYKIVKARPKWDRQTNICTTDIPLEIFGFWQTEDYVPPTAENGIVPRNAYGNVELFKACMLPKKTVHLQFAGLSRVCKKLKIDCAPAVVGFDFHSGSCHPTFDGFVICEEFQEKVTEAWLLDQEESELREKEKYEKRVYDNWKKLIKGLLIRRKLQRKYNFNLDGRHGEQEEAEEEGFVEENVTGKKKVGKK